LFLIVFRSGETSVINNLKFSGIFETSEYLNEPIIYTNPLYGRHRCSFTMKLNDKIINIEGVQYEVDSSFESKNKIMIIECKKTENELTNFNIRQLYYPYRVIYDANKGKKEIICMFIHNIKDIIHIWKYKFTDYLKMDSIECISYNKYKLKNIQIKQDILKEKLYDA
jgi:hypothetical protein